MGLKYKLQTYIKSNTAPRSEYNFQCISFLFPSAKSVKIQLTNNQKPCSCQEKCDNDFLFLYSCFPIYRWVFYFFEVKAFNQTCITVKLNRQLNTSYCSTDVLYL